MSDRVRIRCTFTPPPTVAWMKDGDQDGDAWEGTREEAKKLLSGRKLEPGWTYVTVPMETVDLPPTPNHNSVGGIMIVESCTRERRCYESGVKAENRRRLRAMCAICGEPRMLHGAEHPHTRGDACPGFVTS